jgi:hypothetical protein
VFRWILRTGCGLVLGKRFWFDERLMSANGRAPQGRESLVEEESTQKVVD